MFTIGTLSRRTGVNIETIRYYERVELLAAPPRTESGRRLYADEAVRRLAFVRHARGLGFELPAIRTLLALQDTPEASCDEVTRIAGSQLAAVETRIAQLGVLREELKRLTAACANGRVADCRIIEALSPVN